VCVCVCVCVCVYMFVGNASIPSLTISPQLQTVLKDGLSLGDLSLNLNYKRAILANVDSETHLPGLSSYVFLVCMLTCIFIENM